PAEFPREVQDQARASIDKFNSTRSWAGRMDLSDEVICTIDPDDAKDYDDAISLKELDKGEWELGVHIADVSYFVVKGTPLELLDKMNVLAKRIQRRRLEEGQIVLELPEVELVLDEEGKVVGTEKEDTSFTHTLIEMFMVEANEAVARLFDSMNLPFMRRIHP